MANTLRVKFNIESKDDTAFIAHSLAHHLVVQSKTDFSKPENTIRIDLTGNKTNIGKTFFANQFIKATGLSEKLQHSQEYFKIYCSADAPAPLIQHADASMLMHINNYPDAKANKGLDYKDALQKYLTPRTIGGIDLSEWGSDWDDFIFMCWGGLAGVSEEPGFNYKIKLKEGKDSTQNKESRIIKFSCKKSEAQKPEIQQFLADTSHMRLDLP